jgi:hypothetical protein
MLQDTQLSGEIPESLSSLHFLGDDNARDTSLISFQTGLNLSNTKLTGPLPSSWNKLHFDYQSCDIGESLCGTTIPNGCDGKFIGACAGKPNPGSNTILIALSASGLLLIMAILFFFLLRYRKLKVHRAHKTDVDDIEISKAAKTKSESAANELSIETRSSKVEKIVKDLNQCQSSIRLLIMKILRKVHDPAKVISNIESLFTDIFGVPLTSFSTDSKTIIGFFMFLIISKLQHFLENEYIIATDFILNFHDADSKTNKHVIKLSKSVNEKLIGIIEESFLIQLVNQEYNIEKSTIMNISNEFAMVLLKCISTGITLQKPKMGVDRKYNSKHINLEILEKNNESFGYFPISWMVVKGEVVIQTATMISVKLDNTTSQAIKNTSMNKNGTEIIAKNPISNFEVNSPIKPKCKIPINKTLDFNSPDYMTANIVNTQLTLHQVLLSQFDLITNPFLIEKFKNQYLKIFGLAAPDNRYSDGLVGVFMNAIMLKLTDFYSELKSQGIGTRGWKSILNNILSGNNFQSKREVLRFEKQIHQEIIRMMKFLFSMREDELVKNVHNVSFDISMLIFKCLATGSELFVAQAGDDGCYDPNEVMNPFKSNVQQSHIVQFPVFWSLRKKSEIIYKSSLITVESRPDIPEICTNLEDVNRKLTQMFLLEILDCPDQSKTFSNLNDSFSKQYDTKIQLSSNPNILANYILSVSMSQLLHFYSDLVSQNVSQEQWLTLYNNQKRGLNYESSRDILQLQREITDELSAIFTSFFSKPIGLHSSVSIDLATIILKLLSTGCVPFVPMPAEDGSYNSEEVCVLLDEKWDQVIYIPTSWSVRIGDKNIMKSNMLAIKNGVDDG